MNDVLEVRLKVGPFVQLNAIVYLEDARVIRLIDIASLLEGFDIVEAVLTKAKRSHQLVVVSRRD